MHAAVLTFPGHFWQTQLCVRRLCSHYPEITRISFILDDVDASPWDEYVSDFVNCLNLSSDISRDIHLVTSLKGINFCVAGWWRQQLVKLSLDNILDGHKWFVVDGDVLFSSRCNVYHKVPISRRGDHESNWSLMSVNYVRDVLGHGPGYLTDGNTRVITSPVPFRHLDKLLLSQLRQHVEARFNDSFIDLHLRWFQDQTIVADITPPVRWVMTEWELIESYKKYVLAQDWPMLEVGSGYPLDVDITAKQNGENLFQHSYQRDSEIGAEWFQSYDVDVRHDVWQRSNDWYNYRERRMRS